MLKPLLLVSVVVPALGLTKVPEPVIVTGELETMLRPYKLPAAAVKAVLAE